MGDRLSNLVKRNNAKIDLRKIPNSLEAIEALERQMQEAGEEAPTQVNHYVSRDVYVRELVIPKGVLVIGRVHKYDHVSIMLEGEMLMWTSDKGAFKIKAPFISTTKAGSKRVGFALSDTRFVTAHGTPNVPDWDPCLPDEELKALFTTRTMIEYNLFATKAEQLQLAIPQQPLIEMW
jgi:hypothetical protein